MCNESTVTLKEQVSQIGATENVRWTASEVRGSGWKPGWYKAEVQRYCDESYVVTLLYISEQNESYIRGKTIIKHYCNKEDKTFAISHLTTHIHICN